MRGGLRTAHLWSRDRRCRPWCGALLRSAVDLYEWGRDLPCGAWCNVCGWRGVQFRGSPHSESAYCPSCRSVARDRFLVWCWTNRRPYRRADEVLETSPRLRGRYRSRMARVVRYRASDFDQRGHAADLTIDLQGIDLPDASLDVVMTAHTLEHVEDPAKALAELHRVVRPGGVVFLMVPMAQGRTRRPAGEEHHDDDTLVRWRFGWDLADLLDAAGFRSSALVTQDLADRVATNHGWGYVGPDADSDDLLRGAAGYEHRMQVVLDGETTSALACQPSFQFVIWEARRP
ncbi:MAG TPA: class I SAM-dependent methyltransferase [Mycobacteriales bacterium]|nr:class I SAM-dependent methyltransferase [Mycobacteriales bacterium]